MVTSMRRATALVLLAYAAAFVLAMISGRAMEGSHPLVVALVADCAATIAVFAFSMSFDNSSFYDPYWSVIPFPVAWYWSSVPEAAGANPVRQAMVLFALAFWGARLTWNWFRQWHGLDHEDWRYVDIRAKTGRAWPLASLAGVHFFPTLIVFAGLLPVWSAMVSPAPLGVLDAVAFVVAVGATVIEAAADQQLRRYLDGRTSHETILATGLWKYSRHPNYFGENAFWWGLALFGLAADPHLWSVAGAIAMTVMFVFISVPLLDERSAVRRPGYREHMKRVSALVPLPPRTGVAGGADPATGS
jgi:steroid 5-alpha reductase family enzyme